MLRKILSFFGLCLKSDCDTIAKKLDRYAIRKRDLKTGRFIS